MHARVAAFLLGACLCAQMQVLSAQSDLAEVLTTQSRSGIGQPLQARINVGSLPSIQGDITVSLASQRAFESLDIGRYQVFNSLRFGLRMNSAENYLLDISSRVPLNEPSLRFVVAFQGDGASSRTPVLMPIEVLIPILDASGIERLTLLSRPNETLWRIANRTRDDDVTSAQQMLAVQQLNPESFLASNINGLKSWSMLALPDYAEAQATSRRQAELKVAEQNASWQSGTLDSAGVSQTGGQVRITVVDETTEFKEDVVGKNNDTTVSTALQEFMVETPDETVIEVSYEDMEKTPEDVFAVAQPVIDQEPESVVNVPSLTLPSNAVADDPFDLEQIEQQIREEESDVITRVLDTLLAFGSAGLLGGAAIITLLVVALLRRRAVQLEQELDGVLGSKSEDASGFEPSQAEPTVSMVTPRPEPSEAQGEKSTLAEEEPQQDEDSQQEDVFTTRLKLAEAYIEMGDEGGARDMLQEVIADGSAEQQSVAQRIMARLDGGDD